LPSLSVIWAVTPSRRPLPCLPARVVFTGTDTLNGTDYNVRDTYTPPMGHVGEVQVSGTWKKTDEETCTKK
jgi:hypothetical protein